MDELDTNTDNLDAPDSDEDWDLILKTTFSDKTATHTKDSI
jgi:hypothetical protein